MGLYEEAIRLAREHGFVQNEAMANELAARFHAGQGLETIAQAYLRSARSCYQRWGAEGKVRQLDRLHPHLRQEAVAPRDGEPGRHPAGAAGSRDRGQGLAGRLRRDRPGEI